MAEVKITGRHMSVSDSVRDYVNEKLGKLDRYLDRIEYIEAVLEKKGEHPEVELKVGLPKRDPLVLAEKGEQSLFAAIDVLHDKAERQLTKIKEKMQDRKQRA